MERDAHSLHHPKYRSDIDGLRAIAVLSVVVFHAFPDLIPAGFIGVDIFFVISGFLISTIIFESLERNAFSFRTFYARRVIRIFPSLIVVLAATLAFGWLVLLADEISQLGKHAFAGAGFFANFIFWREVGYFDTAAEAKPLLHLWSLSVEEQFYILWPLIVWTFWRWKRTLVVMIAATIAVSFAASQWMVYQDPVGAFYSPVSRFWELLSGALLAWILLQRGMFYSTSKTSPNLWRFARFQRSWWQEAVSAFGLLLILYGMLEIDPDVGFPGYWAMFPVVGTLLLIGAGQTSWANRRILSNRYMVWVGLINFPLYLWHWPMLSFGNMIFAGNPPAALKVFLLVFAVLLSWLTYKFIERPIRFTGNISIFRVGSLAAGLVCISLAGIVLYRTDFSRSHTVEGLLFARGDHAVGSSLAWYRGKEDWLFLGNAYNGGVAKLKLAVRPDEDTLQKEVDSMATLGLAAARAGTTLALLVGPNKESVYPEFLPDVVKPSPTRYSSFVLDRLRTLPSLIVHDPTNELIRRKQREGLLYFRSDTHWNAKGAFFALSGLLETLGIPVPDLRFKPSTAHRGDLVDIAKLKDFPLRSGDSWDVEFLSDVNVTVSGARGPSNPAFSSEVVRNESPVTGQTVWVLGDSFANALRPFLNATFAEVRYVGHWRDTIADIPSMLEATSDKPDLILIVRVERSF